MATDSDKRQLNGSNKKCDVCGRAITPTIRTAGNGRRTRRDGGKPMNKSDHPTAPPELCGECGNVRNGTTRAGKAGSDMRLNRERKMNKIDEQFIKEKVNPVVGFIYHTARQLGEDNAPNSMDMEYLKQGTEKVCQLLIDAGAASRKEVVERIEKLRSYATQEDDPHGCTPTWNAALDKAIEIIEGKSQ